MPKNFQIEIKLGRNCDQIAICAKREIKAQKRNKSLKRKPKSKKEIKVQIEKEKNSPIRNQKSKLSEEKQVIPKIAM